MEIDPKSRRNSADPAASLEKRNCVGLLITSDRSGRDVNRRKLMKTGEKKKLEITLIFEMN